LGSSSFVALTSVYEGYGVIIDRISEEPSIREGIIVRPNGYDKREIHNSFFKSTEFNSGWLERQKETAIMTPKAESMLSSIPKGRIIKTKYDDFRFFDDRTLIEYFMGKENKEYFVKGVIGIDPESEINSDIKNTLLEGELPSVKGILIGSIMSNYFGLDVGDVIIFDKTRLVIEGIYDEAELASLTDFDDTTILPDSILSTGTARAKTVCEQNFVTIMHYETVIDLGFGRLCQCQLWLMMVMM